MSRFAYRTAIAMGALVLYNPLFAQDRTRYSPQLEIGFPVPAEVKELIPRPAKLRLYSSINRAAFAQVAERAIDDLAPIAGRRPGFQYTAKGDGEEEFAVQLVYSDGTVNPSVNKLRTEFRVIFDTRPPTVNLGTEAGSTVVWSVQDENLDENAIQLECRWQNGDATWHTVPKPRTGFAARDRYTWANLARENRVLEVRVRAKDKAGHVTSSRIVRLPSDGTDDREDWTLSPRGAERLPVGSGGGRLADDIPGQPQIIYANKRELTVKSKLQTVTRSGVVAVHLFTKQISGSPNGNWISSKKQPCNIAYQEANPAIDIPFVAPDDGRYGFIVIPESGAGNRDRDPASNAIPQHLVEVDTKPPVVKIRGTTPTPGGTTGTKLEIEWDADDLNMMTDPIVIEYALDKTAQQWTSIAERIPNSRRYVWEVPDKTPYKIFVKVRATDKATNTGEAITNEPVIIDLDKPSAVIENVKPVGGLGSPGVPSGTRPPLSAVPPVLNVPDRIDPSK